ncbi:MAG TPA: pyridoxal 5'-phosphate synthase glutaminase subunit PdxT, partial [Acidobacteriaceae bacterium]
DQRDSAILALGATFEPGAAAVPLETVFIRAPRIVSVGPEVQVLARRDGFPVLVRQGKILAATFHPELSQDRSIHRYFLSLLPASNS